MEFIDLDMEEQCDRLTELDGADCLERRSLSCSGAALTAAFRDDDSGRASCCEPDLPSDPPSDPEVSPFQTPSSPPVQTPGAGEPMYTQVSEVKPSGKVLLAAEEQAELLELGGPRSSPTDGGRDAALKKKKKKKAEQKALQLLVVPDPQRREHDSALPSGGAGELREAPPPPPALAPPPAGPLDPTAAYTVVEAVDRQNSLLLTPNSRPGGRVVTPKTAPLPSGYLTPDLLGSITP